jgi:hypothetical protein
MSAAQFEEWLTSLGDPDRAYVGFWETPRSAGMTNLGRMQPDCFGMTAYVSRIGCTGGFETVCSFDVELVEEAGDEISIRPAASRHQVCPIALLSYDIPLLCQ